MTDCMRILFERRSVRKYRGDQVPDSILFEIIRAAQYAPSSWNRQPWRFIVIKEREKLRKIAELLPYGKFLSNVPMAIAIVSFEKESDLWLVDGTIAAENLMLAAENFSLGTCWIAECDNEEIRKMLELPDGYHIITITPLGYPAVKPRAPERKKIEDVLFLEKFGSPYIQQNIYSSSHLKDSRSDGHREQGNTRSHSEPGS